MKVEFHWVENFPTSLKKYIIIEGVLILFLVTVSAVLTWWFV